jgi:hypothetical protein
MTDQYIHLFEETDAAIRKMQDDVFTGMKNFNANSTDVAGASSGYCLGLQSTD